MLRRRPAAATFVSIAAVFTSVWYVSAQSPRPPVAAVVSRAASSNAGVLNPASSPESLGFDSQRLTKLDAYMAKVKGLSQTSPGLRVAVDQSFHVVFLFGTALLAAS